MNIDEENKVKDFYIASDIDAIHTPSTNLVEINYLDMLKLMHQYAHEQHDISPIESDEKGNIKNDIYNFIGTHESIVSEETRNRDENIRVTFTRYGNLAGCRAIYDVVKMLDKDMRLKVLDMMKNKRVG